MFFPTGKTAFLKERRICFIQNPNIFVHQKTVFLWKNSCLDTQTTLKTALKPMRKLHVQNALKAQKELFSSFSNGFSTKTASLKKKEKP